jgi:hypothetical protein
MSLVRIKDQTSEAFMLNVACVETVTILSDADREKRRASYHPQNILGARSVLASFLEIKGESRRSPDGQWPGDSRGG